MYAPLNGYELWQGLQRLRGLAEAAQSQLDAGYASSLPRDVLADMSMVSLLKEEAAVYGIEVKEN